MEKISFRNIDITGGFWKKKQDMVKNITVKAVYDRFKETHRFDAFNCDWKEGMDNCPHVFWDSDVAKWIEGASYILEKEKRPELEVIIDDVVDKIEKNADENGYYNSHFLVTNQEQRFQVRDKHELYCLGHLIEGAIAYKKATGKDKFLKLMCKYTDYVEKVFKTEKSAGFITPGHPELELALVKLYEETGEKRYFNLAEYFINAHGDPNEQQLFSASEKLYNQDDCRLKDRSTLDGHSVRALYLFAGVADVAKHNGDEELLRACRRVFDNTINKRMYITGGVGSSAYGEAFTIDYDLPNRIAYAETCAALALALFAGRLANLEPNGMYADIVEKVIYNGLLSGVSMDGKSFFYENPLEIDTAFNDVDKCHAHAKKRYPVTQRVEVFNCSCCPPNVVRFIPSIADFMYSEDKDTLYVHQYMESTMQTDTVSVIQKTDYPANGAVKLSCNLRGKKLALRIPGWCKAFTLNVPYTLKNGYALIENATEIELMMDMPLVCMRANNRVHENAGRIAVMRGPVVYCAEGVDNSEDVKNIRIDPKGSFDLAETEFILPNIKTVGYKDAETDVLYSEADNSFVETPVTLIPYYAFANRGETDMVVWLLRK